MTRPTNFPLRVLSRHFRAIADAKAINPVVGAIPRLQRNSKLVSKRTSKSFSRKQNTSKPTGVKRTTLSEVNNNSTTFEVLPPSRKFKAPPETPPSVHLTRLQGLTRLLQAEYFSPESGSYPSAIDWTSTVLATHLVNYAHQTGDHRYFSHLVAFFQRQNIPSLIRQNYDDQLWVVLTYLRGAAYASTCEPEWVDPFLERASVFYEIARSGWDDETCGGGMVWGRWARYKNAVTTELWIAASVGMFEVFGEERMLEAALKGWVWLRESGMFNSEGLINDGLDESCKYTV
jgi:hypothetical protein